MVETQEAVIRITPLAAEKAKEIGEDDARRQLDTLQKLTDGKIAEIDKLTAAKEREVLEG